MKTHLFCALTFAVALLAAVAIVATAQTSSVAEEPAASSAALGPTAATWWIIDTVDGDETTDVGQYASVVIDPRNDRPFISYYDATNKDLRLARYVESGGNCGPGDSWSCETVDSADDVGKYTSIDVYPSTSLLTWKMGIAYYDVDNYALMYAESPGHRHRPLTSGPPIRFKAVRSPSPTGCTPR